MEKKAQNLSITTIILIILGIIVLVMLILGFTKGWGNIKDWIAPSNNVQQIVSQCGIACAAGSKYDFCSEPRTLKAKDLPETDEGSTNKKTDTCNYFANTDVYNKYGIERCSAITCTPSETNGGEEQTCADVGGEWAESCTGEKDTIYNGEEDLSDFLADANEHCCVA